MKRVKCYGRVKKTVALEKPLVKDFFGDEDYKTSLWDLDSPKKNDNEKESKPIRRAGKKKTSSNRYFYPSSPDMFTSSFCDSKVKLTSKKGQKAKKEINNENIPESNKRNLRKRLRDKNNEIDAYAAEIQPKWSEIEEHDLCLETYKRYENKNVSIKCISRIQDYDNLSTDKENQPLDVIILSSSPKPKGSILKRKPSRIKQSRNLKKSSVLVDSKIHLESFHPDETSVEKQDLVTSHSKESENLSPAFQMYLVQCQNQIKSKQLPLKFSSSPEPCVNKKISNLLENNSMKDSQYLDYSDQHSLELNMHSEPLCVSKENNSLFANSMKNSEHLSISDKQAAELNSSFEALLGKKTSNSLETSINMKNSQCLNNSKQPSLDLSVNPKPLYVEKQTSSLFENSIDIEKSQHLSNSKQFSPKLNTRPEACVSKKNSTLFENNISMKNSEHLITSEEQSLELSTYSEHLRDDKKISNFFENSVSMRNLKHLIDRKQQSSELSMCLEPLYDKKKITNSFDNSINMKNSQHLINSRQHSTCSEPLCVDEKISNLFENSRSMRNSKQLIDGSRQFLELNASSESLCVNEESSNLFENSIRVKNSKIINNSKRQSPEHNICSEPLCDDEKFSDSFGNSISMINSEHFINSKQPSSLSRGSKAACVDEENSNMLENNNSKNSHSPKLSAAVENTSCHSFDHSNYDTEVEPIHKNSKNTFSKSNDMRNDCSLLLPVEEYNSSHVSHAAKKPEDHLKSPVSFQMSPIHLDVLERKTNKNSINYCVDKSKTNIITSTPFHKHETVKDSAASELDVIVSNGIELINNHKISRIMQVSPEKRQNSCLSDSLSMLQVDLFQKSSLNLKAIVSNSNRTLSQYNISNLFPSSKSSHSLCNTQVLELSAANVSRHSCTSKLAIQNVSATTQTKRDIEEAKIKLLKLCKQDSVVKFSEAFKWSSLNVKKIGEGTYGEVFIITKVKTSTVVKIIPVSEEIGDDSFQGLQNVLSEVKIAQCLSGLRNKKINQTKNFNKLKSAHLVMGQYPDVLIGAWDSFSEAKSTYNDRPDFYSDNQLFVILEQEYGGKDMSNFVLRHAVEAESVFKQIAISLAIAEEEFLFEHRDLHLGNILIQRNRSKKVSYTLRGKSFSIESHGLLVTIIDFTLSRLCETEYVYYNNLADDESLFNQSGDYQFEIYKAMKEHLGNKWHECGLYSNVLWLNFLCVKLKSFPYSRPSSAKHTKALKQLESMEKQLSYCNSATDCLSQCKIVAFPITNHNRDTRLSSNSILVSRNSFQKSKASIIA